MVDSTRPIKVLIAKPGLDGHETGAKVIARALRDEGMEVIYLGMRHSPDEIAATAIDEGVDVVGLSSLSGAHVPLFTAVIDLLREQGANDILLIGGGIIPPNDIALLKGRGISAIFGPGTTFREISDYIRAHISPS